MQNICHPVRLLRGDQHLAGILLDRGQLEREGFERATHVNGIAGGVAAHESRKGLLHGIAGRGLLCFERVCRHKLHGKFAPLCLFKALYDLQRSQGFGAAQFQRRAKAATSRSEIKLSGFVPSP